LTEGILNPVERQRLNKMMSNDRWMQSDSDLAYAARLLLDFGYIHTDKEIGYFLGHPQRREHQLREILDMD
jgi:hypothetical protein